MLTRNRKKDCKEPGPNTSNSTGTEAPEDFEGGMVLRSRGTKFSTRKSAATDGLCGEEFRGTKRKVESHSGASDTQGHPPKRACVSGSTTGGTHVDGYEDIGDEEEAAAASLLGLASLALLTSFGAPDEKPGEAKFKPSCASPSAPTNGPTSRAAPDYIVRASPNPTANRNGLGVAQSHHLNHYENKPSGLLNTINKNIGKGHGNNGANGIGGSNGNGHGHGNGDGNVNANGSPTQDTFYKKQAATEEQRFHQPHQYQPPNHMSSPVKAVHNHASSEHDAIITAEGDGDAINPVLVFNSKRMHFKRYATHVSIAYFIYFHQKYQMAQKITGPDAAVRRRNFLAANCDPTLEAKALKDKSDQARPTEHEPSHTEGANQQTQRIQVSPPRSPQTAQRQLQYKQELQEQPRQQQQVPKEPQSHPASQQKVNGDHKIYVEPLEPLPEQPEQRQEREHQRQLEQPQREQERSPKLEPKELSVKGLGGVDSMLNPLNDNLYPRIHTQPAAEHIKTLINPNLHGVHEFKNLAPPSAPAPPQPTQLRSAHFYPQSPHHSPHSRPSPSHSHVSYPNSHNPHSSTTRPSPPPQTYSYPHSYASPNSPSPYSYSHHTSHSSYPTHNYQHPYSPARHAHTHSPHHHSPPSHSHPHSYSHQHPSANHQPSPPTAHLASSTATNAPNSPFVPSHSLSGTRPILPPLLPLQKPTVHQNHQHLSPKQLPQQQPETVPIQTEKSMTAPPKAALTFYPSPPSQIQPAESQHERPQHEIPISTRAEVGMSKRTQEPTVSGTPIVEMEVEPKTATEQGTTTT